MLTEQITLTIFTFCNAVRVLGYLPQIMRSLNDRTGGASTSRTTWIVFFASNTSTLVYALVNLKDVLMATLFGINALCCAVIAVLTLWKRYGATQAEPPRQLSLTLNAPVALGQRSVIMELPPPPSHFGSLTPRR